MCNYRNSLHRWIVRYRRREACRLHSHLVTEIKSHLRRKTKSMLTKTRYLAKRRMNRMVWLKVETVFDSILWDSLLDSLMLQSKRKTSRRILFKLLTIRCWVCFNQLRVNNSYKTFSKEHCKYSHLNKTIKWLFYYRHTLSKMIS